MEFAVQGNNFLGRGIRSRSTPFAAVRVSLTPVEAKLDRTVYLVSSEKPWFHRDSFNYVESLFQTI